MSRPSFAARQTEAHRLYLIDKIEEAVNSLAGTQPITLSEDGMFPELAGMHVALVTLDHRVLMSTDDAGQTHIVAVEEFVKGAIDTNYDLIRSLRRALTQRINGQPLCSGFGIEG